MLSNAIKYFIDIIALRFMDLSNFLIPNDTLWSLSILSIGSTLYMFHFKKWIPQVQFFTLHTDRHMVPYQASVFQLQYRLFCIQSFFGCEKTAI